MLLRDLSLRRGLAVVADRGLGSARIDRSGPYGNRGPRISFFYGISIYMYWNEAHHARPHFHARYGGRAASIDLDGNLIAGFLPRRALTLVAEWAHLHPRRARSQLGTRPARGPA